MPLNFPAACDVAIDAIKLKATPFTLIYLRFRTRFTYVNVECQRQSLFKVALSRIQHVFSDVLDIA